MIDFVDIVCDIISGCIIMSRHIVICLACLLYQHRLTSLYSVVNSCQAIAAVVVQSADSGGTVQGVHTLLQIGISCIGLSGAVFQLFSKQ